MKNLLKLKELEQFTLVGNGAPADEIYYFSDDVLVYVSDDSIYPQYANEETLNNLLSGKWDIRKYNNIDPTIEDMTYMKTVQVALGKEYERFERRNDGILYAIGNGIFPDAQLRASKLPFIRQGEYFYYPSERTDNDD